MHGGFTAGFAKDEASRSGTIPWSRADVRLAAIDEDDDDLLDDDDLPEDDLLDDDDDLLDDDLDDEHRR